MFKNGFRSRKEGGIEKIKFLYLAISIAILSIFLANLEVNFVWLRNFTTDFRESIVRYELSQASHVAGMMKEEALREVASTEELAENLKLARACDSELEKKKIFIGAFLRKNNDLREVSIFDVNGREEERFSRSEVFSEKDLVEIGRAHV